MSAIKKTYSFDVFDTCLVRSCGTPTNMIELLSKYVFTENVSEIVRQQFVIARKEAEQIAYQKDPYYSIYDIYTYFNYYHQKLYNRGLLPSIEIELEKKIIYCKLADSR